MCAWFAFSPLCWAFVIIAYRQHHHRLLSCVQGNLIVQLQQQLYKVVGCCYIKRYILLSKTKHLIITIITADVCYYRALYMVAAVQQRCNITAMGIEVHCCQVILNTYHLLY